MAIADTGVWLEQEVVMRLANFYKRKPTLELLTVF
jgi:hypothetical protein